MYHNIEINYSGLRGTLFKLVYVFTDFIAPFSNQNFLVCFYYCNCSSHTSQPCGVLGSPSILITIVTIIVLIVFSTGSTICSSLIKYMPVIMFQCHIQNLFVPWTTVVAHLLRICKYPFSAAQRKHMISCISHSFSWHHCSMCKWPFSTAATQL